MYVRIPPAGTASAMVAIPSSSISDKYIFTPFESCPLDILLRVFENTADKVKGSIEANGWPDLQI